MTKDQMDKIKLKKGQKDKITKYEKEACLISKWNKKTRGPKEQVGKYGRTSREQIEDE